MYINYLCASIVLLSGGVVLSANASTEEEPAASTFKKILVSAARVETDTDAVIRSVAVVDKAEIEELQPKSVAEALRFEPNIDIAGGPRPGMQAVNIRGLTGNKILQAVDGVRIRFDSGHRPEYFLDPELLKSVEVIKGPSSSLWGSGAIGGVVAQTTIDAADILEPHQELGGFVKTGYNDNNDQTTSSAALAGRVDNLDWLLSVYYRDGNDLTQGNGDKLENSAKRDKGVLAKAEWQLTEAHAIGINYRTSEDSGEVPSNGTASLSSSNFLINRDGSTSNLALNYQFDPSSELVNSSAQLYWNTVDMDESRVSDNRGDSTELDVFGFQASNASEFAKTTLLYGVDAYREEFNASRGGTDRPLPPEAETDVWGVFAQADINLTDAWAIELGLRYDSFASESINLDVDNSDDAVSPSVAVVWQPAPWLALALRHDEAFRAPDSQELYTVGTHFCIGPPFGCNTFISNPDLEPESAANNELIAKMQFEQVFADDQLQLNVSVFENRVDDFIEQTVTSPSFFPIPSAGNTTWANVDKAELYGFEIAADYRLNKLAAKLAYGFVRGEDKETGRYLSDIPADKVSLDVSYAFAAEQLVAGVRAISAESQTKTPDGRRFDGYSVGDIYATWEPAEFDGIKLVLSVNNVFDRNYQRAFEELPEAGREIIASVRFSF